MSIDDNANNTDNTDDIIKPNGPNDSGNLSAEQLRIAQEELVNYRRALDEEHRQAADKAETSEQVMETTIDYFKKNVPDVAAQIMFLANNSTSDGVRLNACKYVIDCVRKGVADSHSDPVNEILNNLLRGNDRKQETDTSDLVSDEKPGEH